MKAFLLAAGYGTRLCPLTETIPKCMVPICGRPLLDWWMDLFMKHGVDEVLLNTHYLPQQVRQYITEFNESHTNCRIVEFYEPQLLGSGGTVLANKNFMAEDEPFFICYADNLTNADLTAMLAFHQQHNALLTMGLFYTNKPKECGIAAVDENKRILEFVEKPAEPKSNLANAGIYVTDKKVLRYFPKQDFIDFGKDILPQLVGKMYGFQIENYLLDIGNMDNYQKAQKEWNG